MKNLTLILSLLLISSISHSQSLLWQKTYGGSGHEYINKVIPLTGGGYAFTGHSESNNGDVSGNHGEKDLWVAKTDATGTILWSVLYGGTYDDDGYDIVQASDGSFYVVGATDSNDGNVSGNHSTYSSDLWLLHIALNGTLIKQKCFGGTDDDEGVAIAFSSDGNIVCSGSTLSYNGDVSGNHGSYQRDVWVIKADTDLNLLTQKCLGGSDSEESMDLILTADNGFILTGRTSSSDGDFTGYHGGTDLFAAKLNSSLALEWAKCYGGTQTEEGNSIIQLSDGSYAVLGYTSTHNNGDVTGHHGAQGMDDFWLLKLTSTGNIIWAKCYGGSGDDQANGLVASSDGGFAMSGLTNSSDGDVTGFHASMFEPDVWVAKLNSSGTLQWQRCCGGSGQDESFDIFEESAGIFVVNGFTYSTDFDVTLNKGSADGWIIKVTGTADITEVSDDVSFSVFPNPAVESISLLSSSSGNQLVQVIDLIGKKTIEKTISVTGSEPTVVNISELKPGTYFIRIASNDKISGLYFIKN